jgi:hypothetical protein
MKALVLLSLLLVSPAYGLDTPSHGIQGGLLMGTTVKLLGGNTTAVWYAVSVGAVVGMWPDLIGATGVHREGYWPMHYAWHDWTSPTALLPPVALHLGVDLLFHTPTDGHWWPRKSMLAAGVWVAEIVLTYLFIKWITK